MGWLYLSSMGSHTTPKTYLDSVYTWSNDEADVRVLKSSVRGRVYYAAVERVRRADGVRIVFAGVCLFRHNPKTRDGHVFGYKDMDETVGPHERNCPVGILDLLTETEYPYALKWREDCRANAAKSSVLRAKPKPVEGQVVVLEEPMLFSDGKRLDRFRAVRRPFKRGLVFRSLANGGLYRITNLAARAYRIEA